MVNINVWPIFFPMAVDILKKTMTDKLPTDLEGMEASMERLLALIDDVYKYVDDVDVRIFKFVNQSWKTCSGM